MMRKAEMALGLACALIMVAAVMELVIGPR
jgi:hypothetical protein